ncbi:uncharacterized protein LOC112185860 [Rosa chinensis]|uniref:uncharacterized protein LOC112185860 n=1 Tax=Rosa chinensis TaxID=74649 RepID=UPI001AD929B1|nr:uncharacterized protein LOC112185860 [Rosa chinensis]
MTSSLSLRSGALPILAVHHGALILHQISAANLPSSRSDNLLVMQQAQLAWLLPANGGGNAQKNPAAPTQHKFLGRSPPLNSPLIKTENSISPISLRQTQNPAISISFSNHTAKPSQSLSRVLVGVKKISTLSILIVSLLLELQSFREVSPFRSTPQEEEDMAKRLISIFSRGWAQKLLPTSSTKLNSGKAVTVGLGGQSTVGYSTQVKQEYVSLHCFSIFSYL